MVEVADANRAGGTWCLHCGPVERTAGSVTFGGDAWRWSSPDDRADGEVIARGTFAACRFTPGRIPVGPSVGPLAASFWAFADEALGTGLGRLTAPSDPTR